MAEQFPSKAYLEWLQSPEAQPLQDEWEPAVGDYFYHISLDRADIIWTGKQGDEIEYVNKDVLLWVPRLDQLLRMIEETSITSWELGMDRTYGKTKVLRWAEVEIADKSDYYDCPEIPAAKLWLEVKSAQSG